MQLVGGVARCSPAPPMLSDKYVLSFVKKRGKPCSAKTERAGASG